MKIEQVNYIDSSKIEKHEWPAFETLIMSENHNNGHAFKYFIGDGDEKLDKFLIENGLNKGDTILIHSNW